jgi:hypothetical protein
MKLEAIPASGNAYEFSPIEYVPESVTRLETTLRVQIATKSLRIVNPLPGKASVTFGGPELSGISFADRAAGPASVTTETLPLRSPAPP